MTPITRKPDSRVCLNSGFWIESLKSDLSHFCMWTNLFDEEKYALHLTELKFVASVRQSRWKVKAPNWSATTASRPLPKTLTCSSTSGGESGGGLAQKRAFRSASSRTSLLVFPPQSHWREALPVHRLRPSLRAKVQREKAHADAQGMESVTVWPRRTTPQGGNTATIWPWKHESAQATMSR